MMDCEIEYIGRRRPTAPSPSSNAVVTGFQLQVLEGLTPDEAQKTMTFRLPKGGASSTSSGSSSPSPYIVQISRNRPEPESKADLASFRCPVISRRHAQIELRDGAAYITDLQSHHGTHVRKPTDVLARTLRPHVSTPLAHLDVLTFGKSVGKDEDVVKPVSVRVHLLHDVPSTSTNIAPIFVADGSNSPAPAPVTPCKTTALPTPISRRTSSGRYGLFASALVSGISPCPSPRAISPSYSAVDSDSSPSSLNSDADADADADADGDADADADPDGDAEGDLDASGDSDPEIMEIPPPKLHLSSSQSQSQSQSQSRPLRLAGSLPSLHGLGLLTRCPHPVARLGGLVSPAAVSPSPPGSPSPDVRSLSFVGGTSQNGHGQQSLPDSSDMEEDDDDDSLYCAPSAFIPVVPAAEPFEDVEPEAEADVTADDVPAIVQAPAPALDTSPPVPSSEAFASHTPQPSQQPEPIPGFDFSSFPMSQPQAPVQHDIFAQLLRVQQGSSQAPHSTSPPWRLSVPESRGSGLNSVPMLTPSFATLPGHNQTAPFGFEPSPFPQQQQQQQQQQVQQQQQQMQQQQQQVQQHLQQAAMNQLPRWMPFPLSVGGHSPSRAMGPAPVVSPVTAKSTSPADISPSASIPTPIQAQAMDVTANADDSQAVADRKSANELMQCRQRVDCLSAYTKSMHARLIDMQERMRSLDGLSPRLDTLQAEITALAERPAHVPEQPQPETPKVQTDKPPVSPDEAARALLGTQVVHKGVAALHALVAEMIVLRDEARAEVESAKSVRAQSAADAQTAQEQTRALQEQTASAYDDIQKMQEQARVLLKEAQDQAQAQTQALERVNAQAQAQAQTQSVSLKRKRTDMELEDYLLDPNTNCILDAAVDHASKRARTARAVGFVGRTAVAAAVGVVATWTALAFS